MLQMYLCQLPYGIHMILNCMLCKIIFVFAFILVMPRTLVVVDYDRHTISYNGFNAFKSDCIIWNGYWSELSIYILHVYFERKLNSMFVSKSLDIHVSIHMLVAVTRCSLVLIQLYFAHIQYVFAAKYIFICMYTDIRLCYSLVRVHIFNEYKGIRNSDYNHSLKYDYSVNILIPNIMFYLEKNVIFCYFTSYYFKDKTCIM